MLVMGIMKIPQNKFAYLYLLFEETIGIFIFMREAVFYLG